MNWLKTNTTHDLIIDADDLWIIEANGYSKEDVLFIGTEKQFSKIGFDAECVERRIAMSGYVLPVYAYIAKK